MTIDLESLEAALAAATPGEWLVDPEAHDNVIVGDFLIAVIESQRWMKDAALIVLLRNTASALIAELRSLREGERALGKIVQRIDENPNEECPFCEPIQNDAGADHEPECPITAAHAALVAARRSAETKGGGV